MTEVSGGVTGISRAHGGIKMGSCNQLVSNVRLQVRTEGHSDQNTDMS